jgi:ribosomal protein L37AE/L43A
MTDAREVTSNSCRLKRGEMNREKDGSAYHMAPVCKCGSRNQKKAGYLTWHCQNCGHVYYYRLHQGTLVPHVRETAMAIDDERAGAS